jgi:hypothetical protein
MSERLDQLLERAKTWAFTDAEREEQRRSFAFGNANIENSLVTRELVDAVAEAMKSENA